MPFRVYCHSFEMLFSLALPWCMHSANTHTHTGTHIYRARADSMYRTRTLQIHASMYIMENNQAFECRSRYTMLLLSTEFLFFLYFAPKNR